MIRQRSFSARRNTSSGREQSTSPSPVRGALASLEDTLLLSLSLLKQQTELLDDLLFDLQSTTAGSLAGPSASLSRVAALTECLSCALAAVRKQSEEETAEEGYARIGEALLEPGVDRRSGAGSSESAMEQLSSFVERSIVSAPFFVSCFANLFPPAFSPMVECVCREHALSKLVCDVVAQYHLAHPSATLAIPSALFSGLLQRCAARGVAASNDLLEEMFFPLLLSICRER